MAEEIKTLDDLKDAVDTTEAPVEAVVAEVVSR